MPRWEKGRKFTTLVMRQENLLITAGSIGKEGKSDIRRFMSSGEAEAEMARRVAVLEGAGWTKAAFTIDPNAKPANPLLPTSDAVRQLERVLREAGFDEETPSLDEAAAVMTTFGNLSFPGERRWAFTSENDVDNESVLVAFECRFDDEHVAQLCFVFPAKKGEELAEAHVERTGSVGPFLERAKASKAWKALRSRVPKDVGVEGV